MTTRPTPEETIAMIAEFGVSETARRTGWPKATVGRWKQNGPPQVRERRQDADPSHPSHARMGRDGTEETPPGWRPEWKRRRGVPTEGAPPPRLARVPTIEEVPRDDRLTDEQNIVVHLLLCGYHHADIIEALDLSEWELMAWRLAPTFREVHKAGLAEMQALALESGIVFGAMALDQLYRIGTDPTVPERTRGMCLASYLDRVGYAKTKRLEVLGGTTTNPLAGVPDAELDAQEEQARTALQLLQGGRS